MISGIVNKSFIYKFFLGFIFLFIFRFGIHIPAPGVNVENFLSKLSNTDKSSMLSVMTTISSGVFGSFSLLSLGVMPYILASIMTQIVSYIYQEDKTQKKSKDSDFFTKLTRIFTLVFALIQSIMLFWSIKNKCSFFYCDVNLFLVYFLSFVSIIAGSMVTMWIGEVISEYSIGSGISMIIFTNISFDFISGILRVLSNSDGNQVLIISLLTILIFVMISIIVLCEKSARLVEVQYSSFNKSSVAVKNIKSSFIPMKLNFSGVMPMIFTMTLLTFLMSTLNSFVGSFDGSIDNVIFFILRNKIFYYSIYFCMIFGFALIYNGISFNVDRVTDSLRKSGGLIPGVKPGESTKSYFSKILSRLTLLGALYLFFVSIAVDSFKVILNINNFVSGTSYLIITVIALELISKYQIELLSSKYNDYSL
jgi:preprotein translocase subunit SecY